MVGRCTTIINYLPDSICTCPVSLSVRPSVRPNRYVPCSAPTPRKRLWPHEWAVQGTDKLYWKVARYGDDVPWRGRRRARARAEYWVTVYYRVLCYF